jgi:MarR family transcriptional regulator, organic hydroperoxide resistance regulator
MDTLHTQVCHDMVLLLNTFKSAMHAFADEQNITRMQLFALYTISIKGQLAMGKAADVLHCDPSNITGLVDRLVGQGLVVRQESPSDRRTKLLKVTEKGAAIVAKLEATIPIKMGCERLTEQELRALHATIQKICVSGC